VIFEINNDTLIEFGDFSGKIDDIINIKAFPVRSKASKCR
jgi:hypothetical protein